MLFRSLIPVPVDPESLNGIASDTGGQAFTAETASELGSVYAEIGSVVGYDHKQVGISDWFAGTWNDRSPKRARRSGSCATPPWNRSPCLRRSRSSRFV